MQTNTTLGLVLHWVTCQKNEKHVLDPLVPLVADVLQQSRFTALLVLAWKYGKYFSIAVFRFRTIIMFKGVVQGTNAYSKSYEEAHPGTYVLQLF